MAGRSAPLRPERGASAMLPGSPAPGPGLPPLLCRTALLSPRVSGLAGRSAPFRPERGTSAMLPGSPAPGADQPALSSPAARLIVDLVRTHGRLSRHEVSQLSSLPKSTVGEYV